MTTRRQGPPERLGKILKERLQALGWEGKLQEMEVFSRWEEAVGPQIACRARPRNIRKGRLTVAVDSPAWAQQLTLLKPELLRRLEAVLGRGSVGEIFFVTETAPPSPPSPPSPPPEERRAVDPALLEEAQKEASRIADGELREALARLLEASCRRSPPE